MNVRLPRIGLDCGVVSFGPLLNRTEGGHSAPCYSLSLKASAAGETWPTAGASAYLSKFHPSPRMKAGSE
jgi:hypothetical protein